MVSAGKTLENGKQEDPNKVLRLKFNELEATTNVRNFAVIVLSETLLPPDLLTNGDLEKK